MKIIQIGLPGIEGASDGIKAAVVSVEKLFEGISCSRISAERLCDEVCIDLGRSL